MIEQMGFVSGIENYSRHLTGRAQGESPPTLVDYFPREFLFVADESHQTIPQLGGRLEVLALDGPLIVDHQPELSHLVTRQVQYVAYQVIQMLRGDVH